jgi:hypothetical protein
MQLQNAVCADPSMCAAFSEKILSSIIRNACVDGESNVAALQHFDV